LAREGEADAGKLDRQIAGPAVRFQLSDGEELEVYTTRPDTIFGASFVAVAADHPVAQKVAAGNPAAVDFIALCKQGGTTAAELETAEKLGFDTGITAKHLFTGHLPVYIANFVLMDYGTGAIMAVPGHDQRDFDFATKYALPILRVVAASAEDAGKPFGKEAEAGDGLLVNSGFLDGMAVAEAKRAVIARAEAKAGARADGVAPARLGRSRQRYWGTPIPSSIAKSAAWCRCPRSTCRDAARGCDLRRARQPAGPPPDVEACRLPAMRPQGAARDGHARHVCRSAGISCALPASPPMRLRPGADRAVAAGGPVYRRHRTCDPASALCPFLDARAGPHRQDRGEGAFRQPVHAGHGDA
jgi:hypothetical protein